MVLAGVGVLLFFLLRGDDGGTATASDTSTSSSSASPAVETEMSMSEVDPGDLPGGAGSSPGGSGGGSGGSTTGGGSMQPETPTGGDEGQYPGSADVALAFMNGIFTFDSGTVFALSCTDLQQQATEASAGTDLGPEDYLTAYFYSEVLLGEEIAEGASTSVVHDADSGLDVVSFDVATTAGTSLEVLIGVDENLSVCGFA